MSYWYGNADNIAICWHWVGIAGSLCQDMGLHRKPTDDHVPELHRRLWRRVWWCCVHRDRWIALGLGRPMRINSNDCDVETLSISDLVEGGAVCAGLSNRAVTIIERYCPVAHLFIQAVNLSLCLDDVMTCHFSLGQSADLLRQSAECERRLTSWYMGLDTALVIDLSHHFVEEPTTWTLQKHVLDIFHQ